MAFVDIYTKREIDYITPRTMAKIFNFYIKNNNVYIKISPSNLDKFLFLKDAIEHKYCIPINYVHKKNKRYFVLNKYSSYKFLKMIYPFLDVKKRLKTQIDNAIKHCSRAKIRLYAGGPIENSPDHGLGFRNELKRVLQFTKSIIIDPCDFEYNCGSSLTEYRKNHSFRDLYWQSKKVVSGDIQAIDNVDAFILYADATLGSGSSGESTVCFYNKKPVYTVIADNYSIDDLSPWILGCSTRFFKSFDELRKFIIDIE